MKIKSQISQMLFKNRKIPLASGEPPLFCKESPIHNECILKNSLSEKKEYDKQQIITHISRRNVILREGTSRANKLSE
jgi:hypothetical protein